MAIQEASFREMLDEIKSLQNDYHVRLAMQEDQIKRVIDANIRSLKKLQKRGIELEQQGLTLEMLRGENDAESMSVAS